VFHGDVHPEAKNSLEKGGFVFVKFAKYDTALKCHKPQNMMAQNNKNGIHYELIATVAGCKVTTNYKHV